jgi:predicted TIM-barrel fold metal-dependent hydrolase
MTEPWYISADGHMSEPLDLWTERMDKKLRDRAPHVEFEWDGVPGTWWVYEGYPAHDLAVGIAGGKSRTEEEKIEFIKAGGGYADARPGGWDPAARLIDAAQDGVAGEVLFTTLGFRLFWLEDPELQRECFRVYNDWLAEFCKYAPDRFKGLALISLYDPKLAAQELERCAKMGLSGSMIWVSPPEDVPYNLDMYDVFWAKSQELNMPVNLHPPTGMDRPKYEFGRENRILRPIIGAQEVQRSMAVIIVSGVLERFPEMKLVCAEYGCGWVPFWLSRLDAMQGSGSSRRGGYSTPLSMSPRDYYNRQVWITYIEEELGVRYRDDIGIDRLLWSSDYPHAASTWPESSKFIERDFASSDDDKRKIVHDNVAALYGFKI